MNNYTITNCVYDGTSGDPNPICTISGTVNGNRVFAPNIFFAYLAAANAAGQMQQALTAVLYNGYAAIYGFEFRPFSPQVPILIFPLSSEVALRVQGPYPQPRVAYSPALLAPWSA
jgi:hypothetical protein